jgi:hypothetical protein
MKCIKLNKETKNIEVGAVIRVTDIDAELKVKSGSWSFVPKSVWKEYLNGLVVEKIEEKKEIKEEKKKENILKKMLKNKK